MKKIIVLKDGEGRLANKLWNAASIYSYCLERGFAYHNHAFFRYQHYFDTVCNFLFFKFYYWHKNFKLGKILYNIYYLIILVFLNKRIVRDYDLEFLLPPTENNNPKQRAIIDKLCLKNDGAFYFCGWVFRNPDGFKKYYKEIKKFFRPKEMYYSEIIKLKNQLKEKYKLIVGVHIRQGDYQTWQGGQHYFTNSEVRENLNDFIANQTEFNKAEIVFVICSDGPIENNKFVGLNIVRGPGSEITDLYMLAETDLIIGSNSTYGSWAAYYGNIPFFHFSRNKVNWDKPNKAPILL